MASRRGPNSGDGVEQEILSAHRRLDVLMAEACGACRDTENSDGALSVFESLQVAMLTHLNQEDRLYYPSIWALRPDLEPQLRTFVDQHGEFRHQLKTIGELLSSEEIAEAGRTLEALTGRFGKHEVAEEALLRRLDREIAEPT